MRTLVCFNPIGIPIIYDLGAPTLTIEDECLTLAEKVSADEIMQEVCLSEREAYNLLVTLCKRLNDLYR